MSLTNLLNAFQLQDCFSRHIIYHIVPNELNMEKNNSRTGRTKRPTERFQSFLESSKSSSTKRSTNKGDNTMTDGDDDQNNLHISKKSRSRRVFSCSHCGFSCSTSLSSQDFIKSHHMKVEHKVCYDNGLIHCPNRSCKKVFLTETDMEKHCTMKGSNNPCLMAAILVVPLQHKPKYMQSERASSIVVINSK